MVVFAYGTKWPHEQMALVGGFHVVVWTILSTRRHVVASLYLKGFSLTIVLLDYLLLKFGVGVSYM